MLKKILLTVSGVLIIVLLGWRLLPRSLSSVTLAERDDVTDLSCTLTVSAAKDGAAQFDVYTMDVLTAQDTCVQEIWDILTSSDYRQDFRNALPWNIEGAESDKNHDGRIVNLVFSVRSRAGDACFITLSSRSMMTAQTGSDSGLHIYHPVNPGMFDALADYIKLHGEAR